MGGGLATPWGQKRDVEDARGEVPLDVSPAAGAGGGLRESWMSQKWLVNVHGGESGMSKAKRRESYIF